LILEARHRLGDILERLAGVLVLQRADIEPERADRGRAVGCRIACTEFRKFLRNEHEFCRTFKPFYRLQHVVVSLAGYFLSS
jgi:hypothetical protein